MIVNNAKLILARIKGMNLNFVLNSEENTDFNWDKIKADIQKKMLYNVVNR